MKRIYLVAIIFSLNGLAHVGHECNLTKNDTLHINGPLEFTTALSGNSYITGQGTQLYFQQQIFKGNRVQVLKISYLENVDVFTKWTEIELRLKRVRYGSPQFVKTGIPGYSDIDHFEKDMLIKVKAPCQLSF
jgi:hypothetical protein